MVYKAVRTNDGPVGTMAIRVGRRFVWPRDKLDSYILGGPMTSPSAPQERQEAIYAAMMCHMDTLLAELRSCQSFVAVALARAEQSRSDLDRDIGGLGRKR